MLNFRFIKAQFKNVGITILSFAFAYAVLIAFALAFPLFGEKGMNEINDKGQEVFGEAVGGNWTYLNVTIFGISSLCLFFVFGISMSIILIQRDLNRGYIASWMTTSMSRPTIFNSKLFVIITSTLMLNLWTILFEMIAFKIRMEDFNLVVGNLLLGNLTLICFSLMIVSGCWIIFSIFQKVGLALGILIGIMGWFILCSILITLSMNPLFPNLADLKYFKYFTIQSFFNSPLQFGKRPELPTDPGEHTVYAPLLSIQAKDFVWQLPVMIAVSCGLFTGAQFIIKDKNFAF